MTEQEKPFHKTTLGRVCASFICAAMIGTAAIEIALLAEIGPRAHASLADQASFDASASALALMWLIYIYLEWIHRYDLRKARQLRLRGLVLQALLVGLNLIGGRHHLPDVVAALFLVFLSAVCWQAWMSTAKLHPENQKIVSQLLAERDDAHSKELAARDRERRLQDALDHLGLALPLPPGSGEPAPEPPHPAPKWDIRRGRHAPVVYFIRNGNRIKIGTTTDLYQRIRRLAMRAEDVALVIPGSRDKERALHRQFAELRVGNTEWFRDEPPLTDFITERALQAANNTKKEV